MSLVILIPALKPSSNLPEVIDALVADERVERVILVNDGSPPESDPIFQAAAQRPKVTLLRHAVNLGKGAALRTGMNHFLCTASPDAVLVTADADGQHLPVDILAVGAEMLQAPHSLILGCRVMPSTAPLRSRFGNALTRRVFSLLVGEKLTDTQTGLRAIPRSLMPALMRVKASGYEFELEMLILAAREKCRFKSVPISTIYLEGNASSHFNPLLDSMRIYFVFVRFLSSSVLTAIIDYAVFAAAFAMSGSLSAGIAAGRVVAGVFNFSVNKLFVFHSRTTLLRAFVRYATLVAVLGCLAYFLIGLLIDRLGWNPYLSKVVVEGLLVLASFLLQRDLVFTSEAPLSPGPMEKTDWDSYYSKPYASARYSRRITGALLKRVILEFRPEGDLRLVELGGANSCFYTEFLRDIQPKTYDVVDNNELGLEAFRQKVPEGVDSTGYALDVLSPEVSGIGRKYDLCFSVGLVEHFDEAGTERAIAAHFDLLRPGGVAIITYPTPTLLYRATRGLAEMSGQWIFWDERPLQHEEVTRAVTPHGEVLHRETNWWIFLTQGVVVVRKSAESKS